MRILLLLVAALWSSIALVQAKQVPAEEAQLVASNFLKSLNTSSAGRTSFALALAHQEVSKASNPGGRLAPTTYFYVFNLGQEQGMVFVAGDDKVNPILGYTEAGSYDPKRMPPHFIKWLEYYKNEIRFAIEHLQQDDATGKAWQSLREGTAGGAAARTTAVEVGPLVATKWDQSPFYNQLCPYDSKAQERTVTGCVATAMAQIMKYWEYPKQGSGFHSYNHALYGTLSANFSNTTYDWANMPTTLNGQNTAVATLMQHLGVSVDMNYDIAERGGSGAYVITSASPVEHCSEYAMKTYFGYEEVQGVQRANYTLTNWVALLKQQLDARQPILYAGFGSGGGHAFVCDGYNSSDMFHINWGWGGYADGYFAITALNPDGVGTGGGNGGFNSGHQAVINIKAPTAPVNDSKLELNASLQLSAPTIYFTQGFSLKADIINKGTSSFRGDYAAAAFDADGNFVDFIQQFANNELPAGYHYTDGLSFETEGLASLLPGNYSIGLFYKPVAGEWKQLSGNSFLDKVTLEVIYPNDLKMGSAFTVNEGQEVFSHSAATVTFKLKNSAATAFNGVVDVSLYKLNGDFAADISTKGNIQVCAGCTSETLTFSTESLDVEPGTYLVAALFHPNTDEWDIVGSETFINPAKVIVKTAPIVGDPYEDNDEVEKAYQLVLQENDGEERLTTPGANIHVGTDYDYYKLELPAEGRYRISLRVHDAYNSDDNNTYSNDVLFTYSIDGETESDVYDDVMPGTIDVDGGSTLYVLVASYFQGETGTYTLEADINYFDPNGVDDEEINSQLEVYPNPTKGPISILSKKPFDRIEVLSLSGTVLKQQEENNTTLDLSDLAAGMYLIRTISGTEVSIKRVVKQ